MSQTKREELIAEIEAFCAQKGLSDRQFSDVATQNPKFMTRLRRNAVASRTMEAADVFMAEHRDTRPDVLRQMVEEQRRPAAAQRQVEPQDAA